MGLSVTLGLERYFGHKEPEVWEAALRHLVESGITDRVRDVISDDEGENGKARVYEAYRENSEVHGRYLSESEAAPILTAIGKAKEQWGDCEARFSWDQLDEWNIGDVQDLALKFDDESRKSERLTLTFPTKTSARVISLHRSKKNWGDYTQQELIAKTMHEMAETHRLIIHSA